MFDRTPLPRFAALAPIVAFAAGCSGLTDPDAPGWRQVEAEIAPRPQSGHRMVLDGARDRLILIGDPGGADALADTWAFSLETERWEELATSSGPGSRIGASVLLDAPRDRVLLVGGDLGVESASNEAWALDLATLAWSELPPIPAGRFEAMATNDDRHAWFFAGFAGQQSDLDDLWELDLATDTWSARTDTGPHPAARASGGIAKRGDQLVITMGHRTAALAGDTWEYGLSSLHWYQLAPEGEPVAGTHHAYADDAECGTLLLVGGDDDDRNDVGVTSALVQGDPPRFEVLPSSNFLPARHNAAAAVDPSRRNLIVFGGWQGLGAALGDTWVHPLGGCL